jgi:hypothetical protein
MSYVWRYLSASEMYKRLTRSVRGFDHTLNENSMDNKLPATRVLINKAIR